MVPEQIYNQLGHIASVEDFITSSGDLIDQWKTKNIGIEAVEPILQFIENYPSIDFGMPGPLVHFVERFYRNGYEEKLLTSISRRPTQHTVWMLNRVINGTNEPAEKQRFVAALAQAKLNPMADIVTVDQIDHFLGRLAGS